jgi:predicted amidophosphoribosyltransferase
MEILDRFGKPVPVSVRDWHWHAVCPRCGRHAPALDGTVETMIARACGECGLPASSAWSIVSKRWVSEAIWWRPWTWGNGWWESAADDK